VGMDFVRELKSEGHRVFLDLKLYDIGETVKRAVAQVARAGADFVSIHGSKAIMEAAVAGQFRRERFAAVTWLAKRPRGVRIAPMQNRVAEVPLRKRSTPYNFAVTMNSGGKTAGL
jgi:hypothetical protein